MTIIEKFERYASQCAFAVVLMTPDDGVQVPDSTEAKWRARQNVIMELGWFMARLLVPQTNNRIQIRRPSRRIVAEEYPDPGGHQ